MSEKELPARPSLEQYKNQARDLVRDCRLGLPAALNRIRRHHPRFHNLHEPEFSRLRVTRTDAQLVLAREHGFESWPKFAHHIETLHLIESVATLADPVSAFIEVACVPRHSGHGSGTLDHAKIILAHYPHVASANIHTAAILADEPAVRRFLALDSAAATAKGGPHNWDALTHLCFSRYLRIDKSRSDAFVRAAQALLDAGASANTGWYEMIDHPNPRPTFESAIYGAAGIARHSELTRLLLKFGADPNDEETPYHVPETWDNAVMQVILDSGRFNADSLVMLLVRKTDWHDEKGLRLALEHGADPNAVTKFGDNALHHAIRRDNSLNIMQALLEHGADPVIVNTRDHRSAVAMAAHRGRGDILTLLEQRGIPLNLEGGDRLIALCAKGNHPAAQSLAASDPDLRQQLLAQGGTLLSEFAGTNNVEGLRCLLDLGVNVNALYDGDPYYEIPKDSSALHVAAWRAAHAAVDFLIANGAGINAIDAKGRTPLNLAVKACVDSYWKDRRTTESIAALLRAGASASGIEIPCGYNEADQLLRQYTG
ncbi:MAG TPA: ankyrin repeat domain-containing protein [Acidobacteriaceae bacterium]|jgi:ankyrin repeat protein|nr:ankyrin repeat domain-containing protein [Acidobacteriaceae bacterium]